MPRNILAAFLPGPFLAIFHATFLATLRATGDAENYSGLSLSLHVAHLSFT